MSKLCRVWEPSQVQATKRSDVAYIIRILSLESCMCCGGLYDSGDNEKDCMVFVYNWTAWFLNQISLYVSFCDDHLFGGSRCGCSVKDISGGWRAIVLVLKRRFPVGASLAVVNSTEFISLV